MLFWRSAAAMPRPHADDEGDQDRHAADGQRHRQRRRHQVVDRPVGVAEGRAQVAVQQVVQVAAGTAARAAGRGGTWPAGWQAPPRKLAVAVEGTARRRVHEEVADRDDGQQRRYRRQQATQGIGPHRSSESWRSFWCREEGRGGCYGDRLPCSDPSSASGRGTSRFSA